MRIHVLILSLFTITISASAQIDTSYHLLWYKGKKVKPNVLITPLGDTITYNPAKSSVKVSSKSDLGSKLDKMMAELNRNNKRADEMMKKISSALPSKKLWPAYAVQVKKAFEDVRRNYTVPLSNSINIPAITIPGLNSGTGKGGYLQDENDIERIFDDYINELKRYLAQHKDEVITWVPTPPRYDFSYCYTCDNEKQKQYDRDFEIFGSELTGIDYPVIQKALSASRQANFLLSPEKNVQVQRELTKVIDFIWVRMERKAKLVVEKFIDDPYRVHSVLKIALATERTFQILGAEGTTGFGAYDFIERGAFTMARLFSKAVDEKDYSIALNLNAVLGLERLLQLNGSTMPNNILEKVLKFNQFKLNVHVSAKLGADEGYSMGEISGDNWLYAVPDSACKLNWILVGPLMNKMKLDLLAAEWKGTGGEIPYVGTKNWQTDIASIKADFCSDKTDSITFYPFFPEGFKELWQFPKPWGAKDVSQISGIMFTCFLNVERTREDYAKYKNPANVEKLKKEMVAKYEQMLKNNKTHSVARPPGEDYGLTSLSKWAEMQKQSKEFSELVHSVNPGRIIFTPVIHNKDAVIIEDKINGKDLFPNNGAIMYAWFHIKLEHDPDGPYPVRLF